MSDQTAILDRYGLIGYPVKHSKSPVIHKLFADQSDQQMTYELLSARPDDLENAVRKFQRNGGRGLNVTVPHKAAVTRLVDEMSEEASIAGAVNTLAISPEKIVGYNTDGIGLVRDITTNWQYEVLDKRILVLGAGGATQGILSPLLALDPSLITIANRSIAKAEALAGHFGMLGNVEAKRFTEVNKLEPFDLIINATSAGVKGEQAPFPRAAIEAGRTVCYDLSYGFSETPFITWAKNLEAETTRSGWGMLIEQAAESFKIWRDVLPDTAPVLKQLPVT
ncbi:MAG: shikimate dehydrogenase [Pseudomonadota bacterium]